MWVESKQEKGFGWVMFERPLRPLNKYYKYAVGYMSLELKKKSGVET